MKTNRSALSAIEQSLSLWRAKHALQSGALLNLWSRPIRKHYIRSFHRHLPHDNWTWHKLIWQKTASTPLSWYHHPTLSPSLLFVNHSCRCLKLGRLRPRSLPNFCRKAQMTAKSGSLAHVCSVEVRASSSLHSSDMESVGSGIGLVGAAAAAEDAAIFHASPRTSENFRVLYTTLAKPQNGHCKHESFVQGSSSLVARHCETSRVHISCRETALVRDKILF